jgi:hypothetical protein
MTTDFHTPLRSRASTAKAASSFSVASCGGWRRRGSQLIQRGGALKITSSIAGLTPESSVSPRGKKTVGGWSEGRG